MMIQFPRHDFISMMMITLDRTSISPTLTGAIFTHVHRKTRMWFDDHSARKIRFATSLLIAVEVRTSSFSCQDFASIFSWRILVETRSSVGVRRRGRHAVVMNVVRDVVVGGVVLSWLAWEVMGRVMLIERFFARQGVALSWFHASVRRVEETLRLGGFRSRECHSTNRLFVMLLLGLVFVVMEETNAVRLALFVLGRLLMVCLFMMLFLRLVLVVMKKTDAMLLLFLMLGRRLTVGVFVVLVLVLIGMQESKDAVTLLFLILLMMGSVGMVRSMVSRIIFRIIRRQRSSISVRLGCIQSSSAGSSTTG